MLKEKVEQDASDDMKDDSSRFKQCEYILFTIESSKTR